MSGHRDTEHKVNSPGVAEASPVDPDPSKRFEGPRRGALALDMRGALSDAIRTIVLPRLVAARQAHDMALAACGSAITAHDVESLLSHIVTADDSVAEATLSVLALRGVAREDILLELFQPVAQRLGAQWQSDECTFADVTLGIGRLKRLMRSAAMPASTAPRSAAGGRALIAGLPGDQHTLGAAIVADLFEAAGWDTVGWTGANAAGLEVVAGSAQFDIIGVSVSEPRLLAELKQLSARLRRVSSKRLVGILAGGNAFRVSLADPARYGIDAIVRDARQAVGTAEAMLAASA